MIAARITLLPIFFSLYLITSCAIPKRQPTVNRSQPTLISDVSVATLRLLNPGILQWRVAASVNGVVGIFVVDTGSERTVLSRTFAENAGLRSLFAPVPLRGSNFVGQTASKVPVDFFAMGGLVFVDFDVLVMNLDHLNRAMPKPIDGILGCDVLSQVQCTFDWRNNTLVMDTRESPRPTNALPLITQGSEFFVDAKVNSKTVRFRLDTGSFSTCLDEKTLARLRISERDIKLVEQKRISIADNRELTQRELTLDTIDLGNIHPKKFPVLAWDKTIVGMDLLEQSVLTINPAGKWMTLTRPPAVSH